MLMASREPKSRNVCRNFPQEKKTSLLSPEDATGPKEKWTSSEKNHLGVGGWESFFSPRNTKTLEPHKMITTKIR